MKPKRIKKNNKPSAKTIENIANLIFEYRALKHLPRACLPYLKGPIQENVAEHSFYTTIIAWLLARLERGDIDRIIKMALIHDLAEVRGGERNLINKFYTYPLDEVKIFKEISKDYSIQDCQFPELVKEFSEGKTRESKIVKDADILSQMLLEKENYEMGNRLASKWLVQSVIRLKTKGGKQLGRKLIELESDKWWLEIDKKYLLKTKFLE